MTTSVQTATPPTRTAISEVSLARAQAISGLLFATFLLLHLANTALAMAGQDVYDRWQRATRFYYQFPVVEIACVVLAASVHAGASVMRIVRRRARNKERGATDARPSLRVRLHRWAGYVLLAATFGHMIATRGPGLLGHPADFSFLTFSLRLAGFFFYPYYALFAASGVYHLVHGVPTALRVLKMRIPASATAPASPIFWITVSIGAIALVLGVLALGGVFFTPNLQRFAEWRELWSGLLPMRMLPAP